MKQLFRNISHFMLKGMSMSISRAWFRYISRAVLNTLFHVQDTMGWGENDRGVSFTFGAEVVAKFLHKHDFDLICRAHQVSQHRTTLLSCNVRLFRVPMFLLHCLTFGRYLKRSYLHPMLDHCL